MRALTKPILLSLYCTDQYSQCQSTISWPPECKPIPDSGYRDSNREDSGELDADDTVQYYLNYLEYCENNR